MDKYLVNEIASYLARPPRAVSRWDAVYWPYPPDQVLRLREGTIRRRLFHELEAALESIAQPWRFSYYHRKPLPYIQELKAYRRRLLWRAIIAKAMEGRFAA